MVCIAQIEEEQVAYLLCVRVRKKKTIYKKNNVQKKQCYSVVDVVKDPATRQLLKVFFSLLRE